eukprot:5532667-Karenia_brevis.AAC.1
MLQIGCYPPDASSITLHAARSARAGEASAPPLQQCGILRLMWSLQREEVVSSRPGVPAQGCRKP